VVRSDLPSLYPRRQVEDLKQESRLKGQESGSNHRDELGEVGNESKIQGWFLQSSCHVNSRV
jgi:hypothetical protein